MGRELISVVVPVYGDKKLVKMLYGSLINAFSEIDADYEFVLVNDHCPYGSGEEIAKLAQTDHNVKYIDLARNFGQHIAIKAGIDNAKGDWVVVMDCDLQDNPRDIKRFYEETKEGYDMVFGERLERIDSSFKVFLSKSFIFVLKKLSDFYTEKDIGNFSIISRQVADEIKSVHTSNFDYGSIIQWLGFNVGYVAIKKEERPVGKGGYNLYKGFKLAFGSIISNSNKPLVFAAVCSFILFLLCIVFTLKLAIGYVFFEQPLMGWTSTMCVLFLIGGMLFAYLGVLGLYVGSIFKEVKGRALYVIKKKVNI